MGNKLKFSDFDSLDFMPGEKSHAAVKICARLLIVCEGTKTEPQYFQSFPALRFENNIVKVDCQGAATNTLWVVRKAEQLRKKADSRKQSYDDVWVVFDRDSFEASNFDNAIASAKARGMRCAWSNEAFELWYLLHFEDRQTPMSRKDYKDRITTHISKQKPGYKYQKNDPGMLMLLRKYGDETRAIESARKGLQRHPSGKAYHDWNPATRVFELVEVLKGLNSEFNARIDSKITAMTSSASSRKGSTNKRRGGKRNAGSITERT